MILLDNEQLCHYYFVLCTLYTKLYKGVLIVSEKNSFYWFLGICSFTLKSVDLFLFGLLFYTSFIFYKTNYMSGITATNNYNSMWNCLLCT